MIKTKTISVFLRVASAIILLQTLYFKFTAHPDSVYIFTALNAEPFGRISAGILELTASILLLIPRSTWAGALISVSIMFAAILSHLFVLGIEVLGDNGKLFILAVSECSFCLILIYLHRFDIYKQIETVWKQLQSKTL